MKKIKIIIEDIPDDLIYPEWIDYKPINPFSIKALSDLETISTTIQESEKEVFRLEVFGYGRYYKEKFYITSDNKKAFEQIINGFIQRAKVGILQEVQQNIWEMGLKKSNEINNLLTEKINKEAFQK